MENIESLLEVISKIKEINLITSENSIEDFNLIKILRKPTDEVNLHSKFIHNMLKYPIFFDVFCKRIKLEPDFKFIIDNIFREKEFIDILLENDTQVVIIENKIKAKDQEKQLEKYYHKFLNQGYRPENIKIYYLTLNEKDPSEKSLGNLKKLGVKVINISYRNHIYKWIKECIQLSNDKYRLKIALKEYLEVIVELTGKTKDEEYINKISDRLLKSDKDIKLARDIKEGYFEAIKNLWFKFWKELEKEILNDSFFKNKIISNKDKYSKELIEDFEKYEYGILIPLKNFKDGSQLSIMIENDPEGELGFGFVILKDNDYEEAINYVKEKERICKLLLGQIQENEYEIIIPDGPNYIYIWWAFPLPKINYFNENDAFLKLANKEYRKSFIEKVVRDASTLVKVILEGIEDKYLK